MPSEKVPEEAYQIRGYSIFKCAARQGQEIVASCGEDLLCMRLCPYPDRQGLEIVTRCWEELLRYIFLSASGQAGCRKKQNSERYSWIRDVSHTDCIWPGAAGGVGKFGQVLGRRCSDMKFFPITGRVSRENNPAVWPRTIWICMFFISPGGRGVEIVAGAE